MKNTSKVYAVATLAGGTILATSSLAHAIPNCNSYAHPVYLAGSTAAPPMLAQIAVSLGTSVSIIYTSVGSCVGMNDIITSTTTTKTSDPAAAVYMDPTNATNQIACDPTNGATTTGNFIDVGISDVYPSTCNAYSSIPMPSATQKDFPGPIQAMTMAVQKTSTESSISAEAAYVVFGWAGQTNTVAPWTDPSQMFIRKPTSGTESMIAWAIGLPPTKWLAQSPFDGGAAQHESGNPQVVTALQGAASANAAIGILSTEYLDQNRATLKALAFQAKDPHTGGDQDCGYLPDSDSTHFDKLNVRQGRYAIFGPVHFVANVDGSGNPVPNPNNTGSSAADITKVVNYINNKNLTVTQQQTLIQAAQKAYTVPQCAMEVTTDSEIGALASYQPTGACGCYYEFLAQGSTTSPYCRSCAVDADCADAGVYTHCNFTYCEAQ
jgi:hypothetical protein